MTFATGPSPADTARWTTDLSAAARDGADVPTHPRRRVCRGEVGRTEGTKNRAFSQGRPLDQRLLEELANESRLLLIAGHYEGIDERVVEHLELEEISLGISCSPVESSEPWSLWTASLGCSRACWVTRIRAGGLLLAGFEADERRLLDCPHYTRPRVWEGREVPEVLLSGDHHKIAQWRLRQREERTQQRRPDLSDNR